jgi:hypothetical protein
MMLEGAAGGGMMFFGDIWREVEKAYLSDLVKSTGVPLWYWRECAKRGEPDLMKARGLN